MDRKAEDKKEPEGLEVVQDGQTVPEDWVKSATMKSKSRRSAILSQKAG